MGESWILWVHSNLSTKYDHIGMTLMIVNVSIQIQEIKETQGAINSLGLVMTAMAIGLLMLILAMAFVVGLSSGMSKDEMVGNVFNAILSSIFAIACLLGIRLFWP